MARLTNGSELSKVKAHRKAEKRYIHEATLTDVAALNERVTDKHGYIWTPVQFSFDVNYVNANGEAIKMQSGNTQDGKAGFFVYVADKGGTLNPGDLKYRVGAWSDKEQVIMELRKGSNADVLASLITAQDKRNKAKIAFYSMPDQYDDLDSETGESNKRGEAQDLPDPTPVTPVVTPEKSDQPESQEESKGKRNTGKANGK